jgi:hypothetical protein
MSNIEFVAESRWRASYRVGVSLGHLRLGANSQRKRYETAR